MTHANCLSILLLLCIQIGPVHLNTLTKLVAIPEIYEERCGPLSHVIIQFVRSRVSLFTVHRSRPGSGTLGIDLINATIETMGHIRFIRGASKRLFMVRWVISWDDPRLAFECPAMKPVTIRAEQMGNVALVTKQGQRTSKKVNVWDPGIRTIGLNNAGIDLWGNPGAYEYSVHPTGRVCVERTFTMFVKDDRQDRLATYTQEGSIMLASTLYGIDDIHIQEVELPPVPCCGPGYITPLFSFGWNLRAETQMWPSIFRPDMPRHDTDSSSEALVLTISIWPNVTQLIASELIYRMLPPNFPVIF